VDSGRGPVKYGDGKHKEVLKFRAAPDAKDSAVAVDLGGKDLPGRIAGDVQFQAETRGGRAVDGILNGKAQWKENTGTAGQIATSVGTASMYAGVMRNDNNMAQFGAVASLAGMFVQAAAKAMTPEADVRSWGSLPSAIYVVTDAAPPAELKLGLKFDTGSGEQIKGVPLAASHKECGIGWGRTRSALAPQDGGLATISRAPQLDDSGRQGQNTAFRAQLLGMF
jgi:hypothetical protein